MNKIDKSNLRKVILEGYLQFEKGFEFAKGVKVGKGFDSITVSGMGGSALPADIVDIFLKDLHVRGKSGKNILVYRNRYYTLPKEAYSNSLNIVCSFSGNTEETIESLQEAIKNNLPTVGISAGGKLEAICKENNIPHIKFKDLGDGFQPRMATGYFFAGIIQLLINCEMIEDVRNEILSSVDRLKSAIEESEDYGKKLAKKLIGKTPVIYSSEYFRYLAMVWKIKINENAKTPAFWNYFPEVNHNEMVGFTNPQSEFFFVMLRDKKDHPQNMKRFEVMSGLMKGRGMKCEIIDLDENNVFLNIFKTLCLGDWTSYYLALGYGQDPTPVDMVEEFKKMI